MAANKRLLIIIILFSTIAGRGQISDKTFQKQINVPVNEVRVDSLLRIFSRQTGVEFSFNSNKISPSKKIVVTRHTQTLEQWLSTLNNSLGVQHKMVGNHIILIDNEKHAGGKKITATAAAASTGKNNLPPPVTKKEISENTKVEPAGKFIAINENEIAEMDSVRTPAESIPDTVSATAGVQVYVVEQAGIQSSMVSPTGTNDNTVRRSAIQFVGGFNIRGIGDQKGYTIGGEYTSYLSRRYSLTYNMRATMNSYKDELIYDNGGGSTTDASVRFTTAGLQFGVNGGLSLVNSVPHEFTIKLGAFVRYQSSASGDRYTVYYQTTTGIPAILVGYDNYKRQETIAVGGMFQLQYNFTFKNGLFLGVQPGFQADTIDEAFIHGALVFGKRF